MDSLNYLRACGAKICAKIGRIRRVSLGPIRCWRIADSGAGSCVERHVDSVYIHHNVDANRPYFTSYNAMQHCLTQPHTTWYVVLGQGGRLVQRGRPRRMVGRRDPNIRTPAPWGPCPSHNPNSNSIKKLVKMRACI